MSFLRCPKRLFRSRPGLSPNRRGLSLLEVILSLAILGLSMGIIGRLYFLGYRSAMQTRYRSEANMIADTKMAELASGVLPLDGGGGSIDENPEWRYAVEVQQSQQPGLLLSTVIVTRSDEVIPITVSLVRFIPDPDYEPEEDEE